jgi:beta-lactamase class A
MVRFPIVFILFVAASSAQALPESIRARLAGFQGNVSFYAKNLESGATLGIRETEPVRTASTIKLAIMAATFDLVARGQAKWTDLLTVTAADKVSGSGVIGSELSDGVQFPLRDLVHLMIVLSDNTATNMILQRITPDAVNAYLDRIGITTTRSLRKIGGDGAQVKADNRRFGIGVSTPRDMVTLLERIERGELVSPAASREMLAILKRCQDNSGIRRRMGDLPVANKTGALDALRSDVGIVYTKAGRIAMAITVDGMPKTDYSPNNAGSLLIADLAKLLVDSLISSNTKAENDQIRALLGIDRPHRRGPLHRHAVNRVMIYLTPGDLDVAWQDGHTDHQHWKANDVAWSPAGGMHTSENVGEQELQIVEIELKQPAPGTPPVRDAQLDPVAIDPAHNKLLFENPQVRVFLSTREAGGQEMWHEHAGAGRAVVLLTDFEAQIESGDGTTSPLSGARGDVFWTGGAIKHRAKVGGSQNAEMIVVEVK